MLGCLAGHSVQIVLQLRVRPAAINPITNPSVSALIKYGSNREVAYENPGLCRLMEKIAESLLQNLALASFDRNLLFRIFCPRRLQMDGFSKAHEFERKYWVINNPNDIRAYGVLIRQEQGQNDKQSFFLAERSGILCIEDFFHFVSQHMDFFVSKQIWATPKLDSDWCNSERFCLSFVAGPGNCHFETTFSQRRRLGVFSCERSCLWAWGKQASR